MTRTTKPQRHALMRLLSRMETPLAYRAFRRTVQPTFGCDGAVVVQWCGMWVCIERDGCAHS